MRKSVFLLGQKQFDGGNQTFGWQIFHRLSFLRLVRTGLAIAHLLPVLFPPHLNSNYVPEWLFRTHSIDGRWPTGVNSG